MANLSRMGALNNTKKNFCVYRYTDIKDGIIKYVGIVKTGSLYNRIYGHACKDEWCKGKQWNIEFFECKNQSEVEAFEAHLIALYDTGKYFNVCKVGWGVNRYLPDVEKWWKPALTPFYADYESYLAVMLFHKLLKEHKTDEAIELFNLLEIDYGEGTWQDRE